MRWDRVAVRRQPIRSTCRKRFGASADLPRRFQRRLDVSGHVRAREDFSAHTIAALGMAVSKELDDRHALMMFLRPD